MNRPVLYELLAMGRRYGSEYKRGLSNHLPMGLIALSKMGAGNDRLAEYAHNYVPRLEEKEAPNTHFSTNNWKARLGEHTANSEYVNFFEAELDRLGSQALLARYLPVLMPDVAGGAFHSLIRLGYALDLGLDTEIVEALAGWAMAYLDLGVANSTHMELPQHSILGLSQNEFFKQYKVDAPNIYSRLARIAEQPEFASFGGLAAETSLDDIRKVALQIYLGSGGEFTALHLVTSVHAVRVVAAVVGEAAGDLFAPLWRGLGAAYISIKMPPLVDVIPTTEHQWDAIFENACSSEDEHVIKFAYTCFEESVAYEDDRYRALAAVKVGLRG